MYHCGYMETMIDHIDGNRMNNRIENLRPATKSQNGFNSKKRIDNTSGIKGVSWYKPYNKWVAYCYVMGKKYNLGYYQDKDEAAKVVKEFREKHHGEFANHG